MESETLPTVQSFCSALSLQAGEEILGTAPQVQAFLLLEYTGAWGQKAFEESSLPENLKSHLTLAAKSIPGSKILLVRRNLLAADAPVHFFTVNASQDSPLCCEFQMQNYQDLLKIDLQAALAGDPAYTAHRRYEPMYLICTHGKRDNCCARFGIPGYKALERLVGGSAWQCSHLGGHRFAANMLCLPSGYLYGHVSENDVQPIAAAMNQELVHLKNLRGRSCYPEDVQAAEAYVHQENSGLKIKDLQLVEYQKQGESQFKVIFRGKDRPDLYKVSGQCVGTGESVFDSCERKKTVEKRKYHIWCEEARQ